ncbi:hypothetical protein LEP1GSC034_0978 [Leptospira interrogans str. 2003000735]|uniref:Uncharacterized protein n=1 Tax=Leptospira interrogans str. 2002000626 TaxID=996803 RepID=A0A829CW35_LEPIR|nr:hypothetical protein LEP1GSC027_4685 [Leptospira interrogans str. 2002000624]EKQ37940.1 hypothetical protein LEP1GSC025_4632 [Leptospira interrogans str. 2002000621]EKQ45909.1 hypothetical protein LEP1GSC026_0219 [Leptospira interrogans str. 2002000623]EMJ70367.1 hypothetical protein LEP1GSC034_0978 [Leptospira interrogans str. 2003000735]EMJ70736.1 hypothetical protein LEP1GSC033_3114 [Leptospira interrogans str. 2002000632]EMJ82120.1 hypothetical protein LEP1GSC032_1758 [Leptospira interr
MFYGDFVSNFFSLDSILFALFDILTLFQGRLNSRPRKNAKNQIRNVKKGKIRFPK